MLKSSQYCWKTSLAPDARHRLLTQRGDNIESLTVARTLDPELSRMTIVCDVDSVQRQQVIKQMNKLINVLQATDLTDVPAVVRELVLLRIHTSQEMRTTVLKEAEIFGARAVDSSTEGFAIESDGRSGKAGRVYRRDGQPWRDRRDALWPALQSHSEAKKLRLQLPVPTGSAAKWKNP
jgi:acetolactate synthase-1/3 small subunit